MAIRPPSRAYVVYVALVSLQLALALTLAHAELTNRALLAAWAVTVVGLGFHSRAAWWILLALNTMPLLAVLPFALTSWPWAWSHGLWILFPSGVAMEATLLSAPMRRHVRARGRLAAA